MSDMTLTQAAAEVRKMARGIKAVELVEQALDRVASLEQQESALTKAVADKELELTRLTSEVDSIRAESVKEENESIARSEAHARKTADQADAIVREATAKSQEILDKLVAREQESNGALALVAEELASKQAQIVEAENELANIVKKTEDAKKKLSAFIAS